MSLEIIKQLDIDFYNTKYISINAKQNDRNSRFILATCYNQGELIQISQDYHAFIRYRKADDLGVFNSCEITSSGKIKIELTEQMLAVAGRCYADLVILNNVPVEITENPGGLITLDNDYIVSSMTFTINVIEDSYDNVEIESSYEYDALNDLLTKATEDYSYVMKAAKISEDNAKTSEENALVSETNAKVSEANAKTSETNAKNSENTAISKANEALQSAAIAEENAVLAEENADISANKALEASDSATLAKSYAIGGTDTRENEDIDNAQYYYSQTKAVSNSLDGSFVPAGTISFAELQSVPKEIGYTYHITDSFVTDDTFGEGAGVSYPSGTNVYYTIDGHWDCFVPKELTGDLNVEDDDNGNVSILFTPNDTTITYEEYNSLMQTITELQERIEILEQQSVLEIVE